MSRLDYSCYRKLAQENVSLWEKIADVVLRAIQVFLPISTLLDEGLPPSEVGDRAPSTSAEGCSSTAGWGYNRLVRGRRQVANTQSSSSPTIAADVSLSGIPQVSVAVANANAPPTALSSTLQGTPTLGGGTTFSTQPTLETPSISANSASSTEPSGTGPGTTLTSPPTGILSTASTTTSTFSSWNTEHQVPVSSTAPLPTTSVGTSPTVAASPPLITSTAPLPTTPTAPPATTAPPAPPARTTSPASPATTTSAAPPATTTRPAPSATRKTPSHPASTTSVAPPATTIPAAPPATATSTTPSATATSTAPPTTTTSAAVPSTTSMSSISTSIIATSLTTVSQSITTSATAPLPTTMSESSTATSQVESSSSSTLSSPMSSMSSSTITATSIISTTTLSTVPHHKPSTTSSSSPAAPLTSPPLPESFTSFTSTLGFSTPLTVTISSDPRISTMTVTTVWTSTYFGGQVTTFTTIVETGVLRTDTPKPNGFASNTGGVIAVALSSTLFLTLLVILIFFTCRRYQFRQSFGGSSQDFFNIPQSVWQPPLVRVDDEDDSPPFTIPAHPHQPPPVGDWHNGETDHRGAGLGGGSAGGSTSSLPQELTFGGQPYMPGLRQTVVGSGPGVLPHDFSWSAPISASGLAPGDTSASAVNTSNPVGAQSESSLILRDASSSQSHDLGSSSPGDAFLTPSTGRRGSLPGPRVTPPAGESRRHSSTPPTSFPPEHQSSIERNLSLPNRGNQRGFGFLKGLRARSKSSAQSMVTVRGAPRANGSHESLKSRTASYYGAIPGPSSLLNPGPPPSPPLLQVNGDSYQGLPIPPIWPPLTLPPSPVPTANSSRVRISSGLLHPRLGILADSQQASAASLKDNEDYMRPTYGQLLNSDHPSTTTLVTQEAAGGSDAVGNAS